MCLTPCCVLDCYILRFGVFLVDCYVGIWLLEMKKKKFTGYGVDGAKDKTRQHQACNWGRMVVYGRPIVGVLGLRNMLRCKALDYHQMVKHMFDGDDWSYGLDIRRLLQIKVHKDGVADGEIEPKDLEATFYEDLVDKYIKLHPEAFKYDYKRFVKQCCQTLTDGAANMYGPHSGLQALIDKDQRDALKLEKAFKDSTQCWDHKMELGKEWKRDARTARKKELKEKEKRLKKQIKWTREEKEAMKKEKSKNKSRNTNGSNDNNSNDNDNNNNNNENDNGSGPVTTTMEATEEAKNAGDDDNDDESDGDDNSSNSTDSLGFTRDDEILIANAASAQANLLGKESMGVALNGSVDVDAKEDERKEYFKIKEEIRELENSEPEKPLFAELEEDIQFVFKTFNTISLQLQLRAECVKMGIKYQEINPTFDIRWFKHVHVTFERATNMAQAMLYTLINILDATRKRVARTGQTFDYASTRVWKTLQKLMNYFFIIKDREAVADRISIFSLWCQRPDHYIFDIIREYYTMTNYFELRCLCACLCCGF